MGLLNFLFGKQKQHVDLMSLNRDLEIVNDCAKLIETTVNPDVFFSRYALYIEKLSILAEAEKAGAVKVTGDSLYGKYRRMSTESSKIETINTFIDRMYADAKSKASKLKTDAGKQGRYDAFYNTLQEYEKHMPAQCMQHYKSLNFHAASPTTERRSVSSSQVDEMQRVAASKEYRLKIYKKYYFDFPEKPFISMDRELNTNWIGQTETFLEQSIIPKSMMTRYDDGLLPGHVYMLYWLGKYANKKIPAYFEYKYGINFEAEKDFLAQNGYLEDGKPTEKGNAMIEKHQSVITAHSKDSGSNKENKKVLKEVKNVPPSYDPVNNNLAGIELENAGNVDSAVSLYEYNVTQNFEGSHPYERLCIIYRKRKKYDDEIRVANKAIQNLAQSNKKEYFKNRAIKATDLKNKVNNL